MDEKKKMDMKFKSSRVVIVGAGPVGLTIACLLKQQGIDVLVLEKNENPTIYSKAIGIHARTLESMHALSVTEDMLSSGHPMFEFEITDGNTCILDSNFKGIDSAYNFVLGLPQSKTENILFERFKSLGGEIKWGNSLLQIDDIGDRNDGKKKVTLVAEDSAGEPYSIHTDWLIGTDGSRSTVREHAGIDFPGGSYGNAFILGDIKLEWSGDKSKLQFFLSPAGYLLVIPMPEGMHRVIAQTDQRFEDFQGEEKPEATLKQLQDIVDKNGPGGIRVHSPDWVTCAPFYHRCVDEVMKGRVILAGDSFHLFSPLGAQGLNTGFQDAFNLGWRLGLYEQGLADLKVLEQYTVERKAIADLMSQVTSRTNRYITEVSRPGRLLRHTMTRLFNGTQKVKSNLPSLMSGILQVYQTGETSCDFKGMKLPKPGTRFPHTWVHSPEGEYMPVAKLVHGPSFTLMLLAKRLTPETIKKYKVLTQSFSFNTKLVNTFLVGRELPDDAGLDLNAHQVIEDRFGALCNQLGQSDMGLVLVRPDGYVSFIHKYWDLQSVKDHFESIGIYPNFDTNEKVA